MLPPVLMFIALLGACLSWTGISLLLKSGHVGTGHVRSIYKTLRGRTVAIITNLPISGSRSSNHASRLTLHTPMYAH